MRALVTGATGFIGSHLVEVLLARGFEVSCLVRDPARLGWLGGCDVRLVVGDCTDPESLKGALRGMDYVFHNAGVTKAAKGKTYYAVNAGGTKNVLEAAREADGIAKLVYVSSQAAAGPSAKGRPRVEADPPAPVTDYGLSKLAGERHVQGYKDVLPVVTVRPSAVYGPRDADIYTFFKLVRRGIRTDFASEHLVSLCFVGDLVEGIVQAALSNTGSGDTFFLADERPYDWDFIGRMVADALGVRARRVVLPVPLLSAVALFSEGFSVLTGKPALLNRQKMAEVRQRYWVADSSRARDVLGYRPTHDFASGAAVTARWYEENGWF